MGNSNIYCACCKDKDQNNLNNENEIKKPDVTESYPPAKNASESSVSKEKGFVYVPEEISSIEFIPYSEDFQIKENVLTQPDNLKQLANTLSLGVKEGNNTEAKDFIPSHFLDMHELLKGNLTTSDNISKVLELKLSDSFSYGDSEFEKKLKNLQ